MSNGRRLTKPRPRTHAEQALRDATREVEIVPGLVWASPGLAGPLKAVLDALGVCPGCGRIHVPAATADTPDDSPPPFVARGDDFADFGDVNAG